MASSALNLEDKRRGLEENESGPRVPLCGAPVIAPLSGDYLRSSKGRRKPPRRSAAILPLALPGPRSLAAAEGRPTDSSVRLLMGALANPLISGHTLHPFPRPSCSVLICR